MKNLIASPDFVIRSPETAEEIEHYFRLNAESFRPDEDTVLVASRRRRFIEHDPDFQLRHLRNAFYGKIHVGSYRMHERWLCIDSSRLTIGCIGGVATHQDYRHHGVATSMMKDALANALHRRYCLLLLDGISDYYRQHGFIDVLEDMPQHAIAWVTIPDQSSEQSNVRVAELSDAAVLLALYKKQYGASMCTFAPTRTLARQVHYLKNWPEDHITLVAIDEEGKPEGYALLSRRKGHMTVDEVDAYSWSALLALLRYLHDKYAAEFASQTEVYWPLQLTSAAYYLLADHLPIRSELETYPDGGWMARIVSFSALVQSLLPLWQERWQKNQIEWKGSLAFVVDEEKCILEFSPTAMRLIDQLSGGKQEVRFSQQVFTQLVFGFRPVTWAAIQAGQHVPDELISVLNVLFPHKQSWIAGSDYF